MPRRRNDDDPGYSYPTLTLPDGRTVRVATNNPPSGPLTLADVQRLVAEEGAPVTVTNPDGRVYSAVPTSMANHPAFPTAGAFTDDDLGLHLIDAMEFQRAHPVEDGFGADLARMLITGGMLGFGGAALGGLLPGGTPIWEGGAGAGAGAGAGTVGGGTITGGGAGGVLGGAGAGELAGGAVGAGAGAGGGLGVAPVVGGAGTVVNAGNYGLGGAGTAAGPIGSGGMGSVVSGAGTAGSVLGGGGGGVDAGGDWGGYTWEDVFPDGEPFPTDGTGGSGNWWEDFGFDSDPFAPSAGGQYDWLRNLLGGAGNAAGGIAGGINWGNLLGGLLTGGLGWAASDSMADAYRDVANQQFGIGAPYRDLLQQSYGPNFNIWDQPGYAASLNSMTDAVTRSYAPQGNPLNNPGLQGDIFDTVLNRSMLPALSNYRGQLGQFGGMGLNTSGAASLAGAGAQGGGWEAVGSGLQTAFPGLGMQNNPFGNMNNMFGNNNRNNGMNFGGLLAR